MPTPFAMLLEADLAPLRVVQVVAVARGIPDFNIHIAMVAESWFAHAGSGGLGEVTASPEQEIPIATDIILEMRFFRCSLQMNDPASFDQQPQSNLES